MKDYLILSGGQKLELARVAKKILSKNKGILAADERVSSLGRKFAHFGMENTCNNRRAFRECLFTAPEIENYIGGVIVNEETFDQKGSDGRPLIDHLEEKDIEIGVKLDKGLSDFGSGEKISVGLEDLENRIAKKRFSKATFSKWRSLFHITDDLPSYQCIEQNCVVLCRYAAISQSRGLVPIIEPEIYYEGSYDIERMVHVAKVIYSTLFLHASKYNIFLPGAILKASFITSAKDSGETIKPEDIGLINTAVITESVPPAIAGVVYLSGGHSQEEAFQLLSAIQKDSHKMGMTFSFSFGRALTDCVLEKWKGSEQNLKEAQHLLTETASRCNRANKGEF